MSRVSASTHARIAILHEREDVIGIPEFVVGFVRALRMAVNPRRDIVFLDELLDQVDLVGGGLDGNSAHAEFFREFKDLPRPGFVLRDSHHAEVHDEQAVLLRLALSFSIVSSVAFASTLDFLSSRLSDWPG